MRTRWELGKYPALRGMETEYLAKIFHSSMHAGALRRFLVYPENAVDGFLYFPFPGLPHPIGSFDEALEYRYVVEIVTPSRIHSIEFTAH